MRSGKGRNKIKMTTNPGGERLEFAVNKVGQSEGSDLVSIVTKANETTSDANEVDVKHGPIQSRTRVDINSRIGQISRKKDKPEQKSKGFGEKTLT
jgi:hypothetical protein